MANHSSSSGTQRATQLTEQQIIEMLQRLPIAVRITTYNQGNEIRYRWQAADKSGETQDIVQAIEQALLGIFAFIAADSHAVTMETLQQVPLSTL